MSKEYSSVASVVRGGILYDSSVSVRSVQGRRVHGIAYSAFARPSRDDAMGVLDQSRAIRHDFNLALERPVNFWAEVNCICYNSIYIFHVNEKFIISWEISVRYMKTTTDNFQSMGKNSRSCLLENEKQLKFFPSYSHANCMLECAWISASETCQCLPHYLISKKCILIMSNIKSSMY